ncbi:MAG TPA: DinB family protein [Bryobacteraceae bacterium]|nr:DinB family protein [Bryobacteraceae bacterium]
MHGECLRIADQLRRALAGDAWHGPPLRELLTGVTAEHARSHPVPSAHSIWEIVLHVHLYLRIALEATQGIPMPKLYETGQDWPSAGGDESAWAVAMEQMYVAAEQLAQAIETFSDVRLNDTAPGRDYDFYYCFTE